LPPFLIVFGQFVKEHRRENSHSKTSSPLFRQRTAAAGRELVLVRYTQPEPDQQLLLAQMKWRLPPQAPPRLTAKRKLANGCRPLTS
jgi:hypothetical protein